jgi:glycosyltransferase involved in cell wall biosynthesis
MVWLDGRDNAMTQTDNVSEQKESGAALAVSIILPFYNERAAIESCVAEIREAMHGRNDYEIVIVNDGSTDVDVAALERLADRLLHHPRNRGYGAAIKTGIRGSAAPVVVITDADGTYAAREIPRLIERLGQCDMAVGDRSHLPASRRNVGPWHRRLAKRLLAMTANYLMATPIPDLNSGLRAFRRADAERFLRLVPSGFSLTATLTLAYLSEGLNVEFVPIDYRPRSGRERSKIRPLRDTLLILLTIIRTMCFFNPLKVFLPTSAVLAAASLSVLIYGILAHSILDGTIAVLSLSAVQIFVLGLIADVIARSRH